MRAAFHYQYPLDRLIHDAKFRQNISSLMLLGKLLHEEFIDSVVTSDLADYIIPVPLHRRRLRERGFNQSLQIIKPLAHSLNIPVRTNNVIERIINTSPQSELDKKERQRNIKEAFHVKTEVTGDRIILFDDIISTGSTVYELARVLKRAGAADIQIWCFARNLLPGA